MPYLEIKDRYIIPKPETIIFKYFEDYGKVLKATDFLTSQTLYFTRIDNFEKYDENLFSIIDQKWIRENSGSKQIDYEKYKSLSFINCWTDNSNEARNLWNNYVKSGNGIAIKSSVRKLINVYNNSEQKICIGMIHYYDPISEPLGIFNTTRMFMRKMTDFRSENEIRSLIQLEINQEIPDHIEIKFNPIDKIILGPHSDINFKNQIIEIVKEMKLEHLLESSSLISFW